MLKQHVLFDLRDHPFTWVAVEHAGDGRLPKLPDWLTIIVIRELELRYVLQLGVPIFVHAKYVLDEDHGGRALLILLHLHEAQRTLSISVLVAFL
mgnify:CR=1 FL=1